MRASDLDYVYKQMSEHHAVMKPEGGVEFPRYEIKYPLAPHTEVMLIEFEGAEPQAMSAEMLPAWNAHLYESIQTNARAKMGEELFNFLNSGRAAS